MNNQTATHSPEVKREGTMRRNVRIRPEEIPHLSPKPRGIPVGVHIFAPADSSRETKGNKA